MSAGVDLWAAHFGFSATPFTKAVPADKLFSRRVHDEAVARIRYCIAESALGVVTGDVGAGKTVALRAAVASLDRTRYTVVYLANPSGGPRGLYVAITSALGATPRFHKAEAINQVASLLAQEEAERHRKVVFAIDEAHLLSPEQLEELRLLANAEMDSASPFAGILLGQPTLALRLRQGIFAALDQRISVRFAVTGMDLAESVEYLRHHLARRADRSLDRRRCGGPPAPLRQRAAPGAQQQPPSWRQRPTTRDWSTTPAPRRRWPSSRGTDRRRRVRHRGAGRETRPRPAPQRVHAQCCQSVLGQNCQFILTELCRQQLDRRRASVLLRSLDGQALPRAR